MFLSSTTKFFLINDLQKKQVVIAQQHIAQWLALVLDPHF